MIGASINDDVNYKRVVVGVIENQGQILIGKKRIEENEPLSGCWILPGGMVEEGESERDALEREMKEETGLAVKINGFLDGYVLPKSQFSLRWYLCSPTSGVPMPGDDIEELRYVRKSEVVRQCSTKTTSFWTDKIIAYFSD